MHIGVTGADGFLGQHLRLRLRLTGHEVTAIERSCPALPMGLDSVIHCAGVNRGSDDHVRNGNVAAAQDLAQLLRSTSETLTRVVYANSVQSGSSTAYGRGKQAAAGLLADATSARGIDFVDVRLPNLFGEGGRSRYNSFIATFAAQVAAGEAIVADNDREIQLTYVGDAA